MTRPEVPCSIAFGIINRTAGCSNVRMECHFPRQGVAEPRDLNKLFLLLFYSLGPWVGKIEGLYTVKLDYLYVPSVEFLSPAIYL